MKRPQLITFVLRGLSKQCLLWFRSGGSYSDGEELLTEGYKMFAGEGWSLLAANTLVSLAKCQFQLRKWEKYPFVDLFIYLFTRSFVRSFTRVVVHSFVCSFICLFICSFVCSFIRSVIYFIPCH